MASEGGTLSRMNAALSAGVYWVGRGLSLLSSLFMLVGMICIVLMILHVTSDVLGRYLFSRPVLGTIVIVAHLYLIIMVFLSIAVAEEKRSHISVEIFYDLFPRWGRRLLDVISGTLTMLIISMLAIAGYHEAVRRTARGDSMEQGSALIQIWPGYWAIPLGAGLMVLIAGYRVLVLITGWRNGLNEDEQKLESAND